MGAFQSTPYEYLRICLKTAYLPRILREELDTTFTEYTNRLRIERSKLYLQRSGMTLTEIACAVGFEGHTAPPAIH